MSHPHFTRSPRPWTAGLLLAALAALPQARQGGLKAVGPIDPDNGFPMWYEDGNGLRLGLNLDPATGGIVVPDPLAPIQFPTNFPDEAFWWAADSLMQGPNASALLVMALEAAFAGGPVLPGDQVAFARIRIRIDGLTPGAQYTVHYPYGSLTFTADADAGPGATGPGLSFTRDVGLAPGDFSTALMGEIGPFLVPVGFDPATAAPGTLIGDGVTAGPVTGSPHVVAGEPANFFRLEGPDAGLLFPANRCSNPLHGPDPTSLDDCAENLDFTLIGRIATRHGVTLERADYTRSATAGTFANVWTRSASGQLIEASVDGGPPVLMTERGTSGNYFARIDLGLGAPRPMQVAVTNISDNPLTTVSGPIHDLVLVQKALYTAGGNLLLEATSSDTVASPQLTASWAEVPAVVLGNQGGGLAAINTPDPSPATPPVSVTIRSAFGGSIEQPVDVQGIGTAPGGGPQPVVALAGVDQSVTVGSLVTLDGSGSLGPIVAYQWTDDSGGLIALSDPTAASPSFTAPASLGVPSLDVTFTLSVFDAAGNSSQDTVVVTITDPVVPSTDVVTVDRARFISNKDKWRAAGTCACNPGTVVHVYLGALGDTSRELSLATVDALGAWQINATGAAAQGLAPLPTDATVWAISDAGGTAGQVVFELR